MRRGYNGHLIEENEMFYGVALGSDYVSEHEWGIDGLKRKFGINSNMMGVDGRTITKDRTKLVVEKSHALLRTDDWVRDETSTIKDLLPRDFYLTNDKQLQTGWDDGSFGILVDKDNINKLEELKDAFTKNDIVITFLTPSVPVFENAGLAILIKSRIPKEQLDQMYQIDKKHNDLHEYEKEIGVAKFKEDRAKKFMACSPKWINYENEENREIHKKNLNTKYNIQYWINYSDNDDNYGWYTVEEIIEWFSTPGITLKSLNKK
jgi:hypothetical protein